MEGRRKSRDLTGSPLSAVRAGVVIFLLWTLFWPDRGHGSLIAPSVRKYGSLELSAAQVRSTADFDHLIVAFCAIAYHRPGHKVNPDFIRALMLAESGGNPRAVSPKNALGLCQLLLPTARAAARELLATGLRFRPEAVERLRDLRTEDLFDPAINILLTCFLISKYNARYDGRLDLVVAAWNAGEGSIVSKRPPNYPETLDLIGKVNGSLRAFAARRGAERSMAAAGR